MIKSSQELDHELNLLNSVASVVDHLQDSVDKVDETEELIESLLSVKLPGIENNELSVVYQNHDTGQYELVVDSGKWTDKTERSGGWVKHASILKIAQGSPKTDDYPRYGVVNNADTDGFAETVKLANFASAFAVPMRLSKQKAIGAFIALRKAGKEPYTSEAIRTLDVVSDRFARFLTILHERQAYDEIFNDLRNDLQQRLANKQITHESEILAAVVGSLTTHYRDNRCYLLLKNPLELEQYYLVTDANNTVIRDFRLPESNTLLSHDVLLSIVGSEQNLILIQGNKAAKQFYHGAFYNIPFTELSAVDVNACKSWLGATIYHPKGFVFGHIILHSTEANAYGKRDVRFLDAVADFTGLLLTSFRNQKKEDFITAMDASEETDKHKLYQQAADYLKAMYGVTHLDIYTINNQNLIWGLEYPIVLDKTLSELDVKWQNDTSTWANYHHVMPEGDVYELDKFHKVIEGKPHILVPMRVGRGQESRRVIGCFAVRASNPAPLSIRIIDEVSDSLARRLNSIANAERYEALAEFSRAVSQQRADKTLTWESLLQLAYDHVAKVMYSQNLYIALHEREQNSVTFPWIYKEGEPWLYKDNDPSKPVWGSSRLIDSAKRGRTEEIILEGKPILINTLQDSKAWYAPSNRAEFVGNPLASWVGVPIFQPKQDDEPISAGILGVIAVYHPTLEYVYSVRDKFFLQEVAAHISGLFRILSLNEVNRQLEKAHQLIDRQEYSANTIIKDLSFRINTNLGLARANTQEAYKDVEESYRLGQVNILPYTIKGLKNTEQYLDQIVNTMEMLKPESTYEFSLSDLLKTILRNINRGKSVSVRISEENIVIQSSYLMLLNAFYSIFEDVIDRLTNINLGEIQVSLENTGDEIKIIISADASLKFNDSILTNEVSVVSAPYYRAKFYLDKIGAKLLIKDLSSIEVNIPAKNKEETQIIVSVFDPNEGSIIVRWMLRGGYEAQQLEKLENLNAVNASILIVAITSNNVSQQINDIANLLKQTTIYKLILLVEAEIGREVLTVFDNIVPVFIIRKLDEDMNLIKREDFISNLKKAGI